MKTLEMLKPFFLVILIATAVWIKGHQANAEESQTLTVAGGCFWCVEADFEQVNGVIGAVSGFTGGNTKNPTYKEVSRGGTGHIESVQITFDPAVVSRARLLNLFLRSVDPTDAGGQFCDRGKNYTTAIFVANTAEKKLAQAAIGDAQRALGQKVVTRIRSESAFFPAEQSHQNYYKSDSITLTRYGPRKRSSAYRLYRDACGRDDRVRQLWGKDAPFAGS